MTQSSAREISSIRPLDEQEQRTRAEFAQSEADDSDAGPDRPRPGEPIAAEKQSTAAALPVICASDLAGRDVPPREWIVVDMIPDRTVTIIAGDGGVGKSTLMLQLAVAVAARSEWIGRPCEAGPVVFLSAEDDQDELHRRLATIAARCVVDLANLGDLRLIPLAGSDAVMAANKGNGSVVAPTLIWRSLLKVVERVRPRLVILDALADVFAGNENARAEARQFIGLLRGLAIEHSLAVVLIAHPSQSGIASGAGTSGSTAWSNSVRSRLYLETIKGKDGREIDADVRALCVKKANYAPAGQKLRLRWAAGCFVADGSASGFDKFAAEAKAERVFLDLLGTFGVQDRDVSPSPSSSYAPAVFEKHPDAAGINKRAFADAMERLLKAKRIRVETTGPPSRRHQRLMLAPPKDEA